VNTIDVTKSFATEDRRLVFLEGMCRPDGVRFPVWAPSVYLTT